MFYYELLSQDRIIIQEKYETRNVTSIELNFRITDRYLNIRRQLNHFLIEAI